MHEKENKRFKIRRMVKEDAEEVAHLLTDIFSKSEPFSIHFREAFNETVQDLYTNYALPVTEESVEEGMSLVCVDTSEQNNNQIIAFLMCRTLAFSEISPQDNFDHNEAFEVLLNDCKKQLLNSHPNIKQNDCFWFVAIGVKSGFGKKDLALKLLKQSLNEAKLKEYKLVFGMPTSSKVTNILDSELKMKQFYSIHCNDIEYKGVKYLKGIDENVTCFSRNFNDWNVEENKVELEFD